MSLDAVLASADNTAGTAAPTADLVGPSPCPISEPSWLMWPSENNSFLIVSTRFMVRLLLGDDVVSG